MTLANPPGDEPQIGKGYRPPGVAPWPGGAAASASVLSASAEAQRASGDMTRLRETETWLALARADLDAAVASADAEQLAAMGPESVHDRARALLRISRGGGRAMSERRMTRPGRPATALDGMGGPFRPGGLRRNPESRAAILSTTLGPDPAPRYDTPADRAKAEAERQPEAGQ